jgi:CRISPR-associated endonuclease/helicase Cas3
MQYNYRAYVGHRKIAFTRPGFEDEEHRLETHDMQKLIDTQSISERLDASWRIVKAQKLDERRRLVDLEHSVIAQALTGYDNCGPESLEGYLDGDWYLTALPQIANPFRSSEKEITLYLVYDDRRERYFFAELDEDGSIIDRERILNIEWENPDLSMRRRLWLQHDYDTLVQEQSRLRGWSASKVRLRFGELKIPVHRDGYRYAYAFGAVASDSE